MAKQIREVVKDAWRDPGELSLAEVHARTQTYWFRILTAHKEMAAVRRLLQRQETLWPDQCSEVIKVIETVDRPMREFGTFLDQSARLPFIVCDARYPLIKSLCRLDVELNELHGLVTMCVTANKSFSQEASLLMQGIRQKLKEMQVSWNSTRRSIQALLNLTQLLQEMGPAEAVERKIIVLAHRRAPLGEKHACNP